ncbi:MAG: hypothetical protein ABJB12_20905 [Pseudomonadota bacterium]
MQHDGSIVDAGWTTEAFEVVSLACEHYGGMGTWRRLREVRLLPLRLSGLVPWLKGSGSTFPLPSRFEIRPRERTTRFVDFPTQGEVGTFSNGAVRIERIADGMVVATGEAHRRTFRGLAGAGRWTPLDALYFFGYALAHYHSLPFTLLDARLLSARTAGTGPARKHILELELPADLHTHSRRQSFHFDALGNLTRHDYHAEVIGFWARGAHFWRRQTLCNGFPVSLDRHVLARIGSHAIPITALRATFASAEVDLAPE